LTPPLLLAALNFLTPARTVTVPHRGYCSQPTTVLLRVLFSLCFLPLLLLLLLFFLAPSRPSAILSSLLLLQLLFDDLTPL
jgi:hypothetical protein